jgi:hypothetical protein
MAKPRYPETEADPVAEGTEAQPKPARATAANGRASAGVDQFARDSDAEIEDALRRVRRNLGASVQHTNNADAALRRWQSLVKR